MIMKKSKLLYSFECLIQRKRKLGKKSYGGTPGHIPNPEVKSVNAESTQGAAPWEDRNLPSLFLFRGFETVIKKSFKQDKLR